ncbi:MAG: CsiV family protein [Gammaproteobacteria bacterium]|nr:CsiV family protein [Gammaproteobacteria bacterium]
MYVTRIALILVLSLGLSLQAGAASTTKPPDRYEVEVLIFQNYLDYLEGQELWTQDTVDKKLPGIDQARDSGAQPDPNSDLSKAAEALEAGGDYLILTHRRWEQEAEPRSTAKWMRVGKPNLFESDLIGTMRFYQGRYLHIELELLFRDRSVAMVSSTAGVVALPQVYRISEHRRIRNLEVNYFDHPKFGALVQVTPIQTW